MASPTTSHSTFPHYLRDGIPKHLLRCLDALQPRRIVQRRQHGRLLDLRHDGRAQQRRRADAHAVHDAVPDSRNLRGEEGREVGGVLRCGPSGAPDAPHAMHPTADTGRHLRGEGGYGTET